MSRMSLAPGRAREYETIYILRPTVDKEAVDALATRTIDIVKGEQGHLTEMELWGRRRLAFPILRHYRGVYVYMKYLGRGNVVSELERQLRLADQVIRYQTILVRNNVPYEGIELPDASVDLDAELPPDADEPEISRERELGLDGAMHDRDRRGRRDDRGRDFHRDPAPGEDEAPAATEGEPAAKTGEPAAKTGEPPAETSDAPTGESGAAAPDGEPAAAEPAAKPPKDGEQSGEEG